jgi:hypothetical protein
MACDISENSAFVSDMIDLFKADDFRFPQDLEGVDFGVELMVKGDMRSCGGTDEADPSKCSFFGGSEAECLEVYKTLTYLSLVCELV